MNTELLRQYAMSFVGIAYRYGGKTPMSGLDCSGLVAEILKAANLLGPHEEPSSQQLFDKFSHDGSWNVVKAGSLAFYGKDAKNISHVAFLIDTESALQAAGGDHSVILEEDANTRQAFVKVRHVKYRNDLVAVIRPRFSWEQAP